MTARQKRYEFFEKFDGMIATAHQADDNAETVLFRIARGTGLTGLCGIPPKRGKFIRPLLYCTRAETEKYCQVNQIPYVTDSTNFSDEYNRNFIRHQVLLPLKEVNIGICDAVSRLTDSLRTDADYLDKQAEEVFQKLSLPEGKLSLKGFERIHPAVAKRVLMKFIGFSVDSFHLNEVYRIALSDGKCSLPNNQTVCSYQNKLYFLPQENEKSVYSVTWEYENYQELKKNQKIHNLFLNNLLDCDKIVGQLVLRYRKDGDTVCFYPKQGTKTLKKLFNEKKIPPEERNCLPILSDDQGIVWICNLGVAHRCRVQNNTIHVIKIYVKNNNKGECENGSK
ncbi:MAG: tRNA lysidine(34) synthetase TilS [Clostridia bacterium]|nr:tRNA lysidine(34) synthetase TilS [Clostridia bacterium]